MMKAAKQTVKENDPHNLILDVLQSHTRHILLLLLLLNSATVCSVIAGPSVSGLILKLTAAKVKTNKAQRQEAVLKADRRAAGRRDRCPFTEF